MTNTSTPSTRAVWICAEIEPAPQGGEPRRRRRLRKPFLPKRDWRSPLSMVVEYRGAAEPLIQVRARGRTWMFSGHDCFLDVMMVVWEGNAAEQRRQD